MTARKTVPAFIPQICIFSPLETTVINMNTGNRTTIERDDSFKLNAAGCFGTLDGSMIAFSKGVRVDTSGNDDVLRFTTAAGDTVEFKVEQSVRLKFLNEAPRGCFRMD